MNDVENLLRRSFAERSTEIMATPDLVDRALRARPAGRPRPRLRLGSRAARPDSRAARPDSRPGSRPDSRIGGRTGRGWLRPGFQTLGAAAAVVVVVASAWLALRPGVPASPVPPAHGPSQPARPGVSRSVPATDTPVPRPSTAPESTPSPTQSPTPVPASSGARVPNPTGTTGVPESPAGSRPSAGVPSTTPGAG